MIADIEDLELAETFVKSIEGSKLLMTFLILCPFADDARLADIPADLGTWIILPRDKIAEILRTMGNVGRAYVGFGAKTVWFVFFGQVDFISMMEINDAIDFSADNRHPECDILCQVDIDANFADGVTAFILATKFD